MKLNHLHISVPNVQEARAFYETYFDFKFSFEECAGEMIFLKGEGDFLLALHELKAGQKVDFPAWYHYGFRVESIEQVKEVYEKLKAGGIEFAQDYREYGLSAANFYCWAPGPYRLEVSWDQEPEV